MHGDDHGRDGGAPDVEPGSPSAVGPGLSRANDDAASDVGRTDDLINMAARTLTAGEPSAQLHHRVRSRIAARPDRAFRLTWMGLAGAAAAVVALFIFWNRPQTPPDQQIAVAVPQAGLAGQQESAGPPATQVVVPASAEAPPVRPPRTTRPAQSLDPIEPLVIEPMTLPLIAIGNSSGVMPIEMDDLQIEPLQIE